MPRSLVRQHAPEQTEIDVVQEVLDDVAHRAPQARQSYTKVPDWIILNERINPTAFRLWCVLRSMKFESGERIEIPAMDLDQVCWLLPGVNGKPTSKTRARQALDTLLSEGFLLDLTPPETPRSAPRMYDTVDEPARQPMRWTGARRKLAAYVRQWRL